MGVRIGLNTPQHERQIKTMEMTLLMSIAGYTLHDNEMWRNKRRNKCTNLNEITGDFRHKWTQFVLMLNDTSIGTK
jgi:hypothetical protein